MNVKVFRLISALMVMLFIVLACNLGAKKETPPPTAVPTIPIATNTPKPTATPEIALGEPQRSEEGGFSFRSIPNYSLEMFFGFASMEAPGADSDTGPAFILMGGPSEEETTLDGIVEEFQKEIEEDEVQITNKHKVTVGGVEGISADMSGKSETGKEVSGRVTFVLVTPKQTFLMVAISPVDQWEKEIAPLYDAVLSTVTFFKPTPPVFPTAEPTQEVTPPPEAEYLRQWASEAVAGSEFGDPEWGAIQATGEPDTLECGDFQTAWASADGESQDWIELTYSVSVRPEEIHVYQSNNPSQIVSVELRDTDGGYHLIYQAEPEVITDCPYILTINVEAEYQTNAIRITLDQTKQGRPWNEIDAVELVGFTTGGPPIIAGLTQGDWTIYTNGNYVRDIALDNKTLWAATGGGVVAWDLNTEKATKYTTLDGLPTNDIQAVTVCPIPETRAIFGTEAGLSIYQPETNTWELMTTENSKMKSTDVNSLDCDPETKTLYIGYTWGLDIYQTTNDQWTYMDEEAGLVTDWVNHAAVIGDDTWIVSSFGVSVIHSDGTITGYNEDLGNITDENVEAVAGDSKGNVWLAAFDGLMKFKNGVWTVYNSDNVTSFPFLDAFVGVAVAPDGSILAGNYFGTMCRFDPVKETCSEIYEGQPGMVSNMSDLMVDEQGNIYISDDDEGISRFDGTKWSMYALTELHPSNSYQAITQSGEGMIMVGGYQGLQQLSLDDPNREWETVEISGYSVLAFSPTEEGMWIGHDSGASFYRYSDHQWTELATGDPGKAITDGSVRAITVDAAGRVWFGTTSGLTVWDGSTYIFYDLLNEEEKKDGWSPRYINAILFDGTYVWVGTSGALFRFDQNDVMERWDNELESQFSLFAPSIYAIAMEADGDVLLAVDRKLLRYENNAFEEVMEAESYIQTVYVTHQGEIWLGAEGYGIYHFDGSNWELYTTAHGLPSHHFATQSILVDDLGAVWFACTEGGLARFLPSK